MTADQRRTPAENVKNLYEEFPYPAYPLLGKPKVIDGYLARSRFAESLRCHHHSNQHDRAYQMSRSNCAQILILGCGEILPYVIKKNEPTKNSVFGIDISTRSIRRARFRLASHFFSPRLKFTCTDIDAYLDTCIRNHVKFDHIDAYGVLHHLPNPAQTLQKVAKVMSETSTMRVMVYNSHARNWIHHIRRAFATLKLSPYDHNDRQQARKLLTQLRSTSLRLDRKLSGMGPSILSSDARFVDAFFHPRELRTTAESWFQQFDLAGLQAIGILDRYGELDDLENPLWKMPKRTELVDRILEGRFENNLELFLTTRQSKNKSQNKSQSINSRCFPDPTRHTKIKNILSRKKQTWQRQPELDPPIPSSPKTSKRDLADHLSTGFEWSNDTGYSSSQEKNQSEIQSENQKKKSWLGSLRNEYYASKIPSLWYSYPETSMMKFGCPSEHRCDPADLLGLWRLNQKYLAEQSREQELVKLGRGSRYFQFLQNSQRLQFFWHSKTPASPSSPVYFEPNAPDYFDELLLRKFSLETVQRLARIGAITPQMVHSKDLTESISRPIDPVSALTERSEPPPPRHALKLSAIHKAISPTIDLILSRTKINRGANEKICRKKSGRLKQQALARFQAATN